MNRSAAVLLAALAALLWLAPGTAEASCQSGITYGAPASFESTDPCSAVAGTASVVTYGLVAVGALVYAGAMFLGAGTGIGRAVSLAAPARGFGTAAGQPGWPQPSAGSAGLAGTPPATPSGGAEPSSGQGEAPAAGIGGDNASEATAPAMPGVATSSTSCPDRRSPRPSTSSCLVFSR